MMDHERRREYRQRCKLTAEVRYRDKTFIGKVVDISRSGVRIEINPYCDLDKEVRVDVYSLELGLLQGTTRWRSAEHVGIALARSSNTSAKVASYASQASPPGR